MDVRIDALLKGLFEDMEKQISSDPKQVAWGLQVLSASKNLERIADHASNIAEDVVYMVEGKILRHRG
jgi:phosphate transport system protein